jgi:thioredoxin 1
MRILSHLSDHNSEKNNLLTNWLDNSENCLVIAVFFAEWAGSVEILRGFMDRIQETCPSVEIHWVNIEQQRELSIDLGVSAIPSTILFKDREVVDHIGGVIPRRKIEERIKPYL